MKFRSITTQHASLEGSTPMTENSEKSYGSSWPRLTEPQSVIVMFRDSIFAAVLLISLFLACVLIARVEMYREYPYSPTEKFLVGNEGSVVLHVEHPKQILYEPAKALQYPLRIWLQVEEDAAIYSAYFIDVRSDTSLLIVDSEGELFGSPRTLLPKNGDSGAIFVYVRQNPAYLGTERDSNLTISISNTEAASLAVRDSAGGSQGAINISLRREAYGSNILTHPTDFVLEHLEGLATLAVAAVGGWYTWVINQNRQQREEEEQTQRRQEYIERRLAEISALIKTKPSKAIADHRKLQEYLEEKLEGKFQPDLLEFEIETLTTPVLLEVNDLLRRKENEKALALLKQISKSPPALDDLSFILEALEMSAVSDVSRTLEAAFRLWDEKSVQVWELVVRSIEIAVKTEQSSGDHKLAREKFSENRSARILLSDPRLDSLRILDGNNSGKV